MATAAAVAARESSLVRAIGVWGLAAGILNIIIGGGIFRLPADVARALAAGSTSPGALTRTSRSRSVRTRDSWPRPAWCSR